MSNDLTIESLSYSLSKQINTCHTLQTDYGEINLFGERKRAVINALKAVLEDELRQARGEPGRTVPNPWAGKL